MGKTKTKTSFPRMDSILQDGRHENPSYKDGRMATKKNSNASLENVEESEN